MRRSHQRADNGLALIMLLAIGLIGCAPTDPVLRHPSSIPFQSNGAWRPLFQGIHYATLTAESPRPMVGHIMRIDLQAPGMDVVVTPDNGARPEETDGLTTSHFLEKTACQVAINANPFSPVRLVEGEPHDVVGLMVDRGRVTSPPEGDLPALMFDQDRRAWIGARPFDRERIYHAVGGFSIVLQNGEIVPGNDSIHPRTAAGLSPDGRYLFWLVVDGRQKGYSEGATTAELAQWLQALGASEGINLDGGGTSTMVMEGADGQPLTLNRPIHRGQPGLERPSGGHLGLRANPAPR